MATIKLRCPSCHGEDVKKHGTGQVKHFFCGDNACSPFMFRVDYVYEAQSRPEVENSAAETAVLNTEAASVQCPSCRGGRVRKFGKRQGKQIYKCNDADCSRTTFRQEYAYKACDPRVKNHILDLTANGKGARAISRMLSISKDTVTNTLKKLEEVGDE
ncbi:MAG: IS1-like element transposase [Defluviitaleaceae bacterium]|nr:IS1-like element transposase [Defluviitaleaceae bacterium]